MTFCELWEWGIAGVVLPIVLIAPLCYLNYAKDSQTRKIQNSSIALPSSLFVFRICSRVGANKTSLDKGVSTI